MSPFAMGAYVGPIPFDVETVMDAPSTAQPVMVLFKRNLERAAREPHALVHEIRDTLIWELGPALGYSEPEIDALLADTKSG